MSVEIYKVAFTSNAPGSNWNLEMLVFLEGGNWKNDQSKDKSRTNNKLNPHMVSPLGFKPRPHWWEGGKCSHQYTIPTPS